jgi:hypothetical protein
MKRIQDIPEFKNEDEEADFWATHDTADYFDLSELREVSFPNLKQARGLIPVMLDEETASELRDIAEDRFIDLPELAAQYVREGVRKDTLQTSH